MITSRAGPQKENQRRIVFSANINVFTYEETSAETNEVRSWGWLPPGVNREEYLRRLEAESAHTLRMFPDGNRIANAYVRGKSCFTPRQRKTLFHPLSWVVVSVAKSDRVVMGASLEGIDGIMQLVAFLFANLLGKPIYLYSETWVLAGRARTVFYRLLAERAYRILFPGKVHGRFHEHLGIQPERLVHIPSIYTPLPSIQPSIERVKRTHTGEWTVLYVGRVTPLKGLDRLIEIIHSLIQEGYTLRLLIQPSEASQYMGQNTGYRSTCFRRAVQLLGPHVSILEPTQEVYPVYSQSDVVVMPNRVIPNDRVPIEAWGRVVEEALLAGIPVISTNAVAASLELIHSGVNGVVVPWEQDRYLQDALVDLMGGLHRT